MSIKKDMPYMRIARDITQVICKAMAGLGAWFLMAREQRLLHEGPRQQKSCPKTQAHLSARIISLTLTLCLLAPITAPWANASFSPQYTTLRIGLFWGTSVLPSANLQNVSGAGSGYHFGYYDTNRNFVPIGAWTETTAISITMDRNMVWHPGAAGGRGEYQEGTTGGVVVGCFHVQLNAGYSTYEEASAEAARHQEAFVRYQASQPNPFLVLIGQHTTRAEAEGAIGSLGISGAAVNAGTSNTITVTRTGTNTILFEFDMGNTPLGVMPRSVAGETPETWFRGYRYNGGFQYSRRDGDLLTVANLVDIEDYVKGILPYEMSNAWPLEALKAQALCARSFAMRSLNRHGSSGIDLCVEEHCQVYRGRGAANERTDQAVDETSGMYITYNGQLVEAFYASSNGGASENVENVWFEARPYLRGVIDPYEADVIPRIRGYTYNWTITHTQAQLTERIRSRFPNSNLSTIASVRVGQYSPTGNVLNVIMTDVNGRSQTFSGRAQILQALGAPTLRFDVGGASWGGQSSIFANDPATPVSSGTSYFGITSDGASTSAPSGSMYAITGSGDLVTVAGEPTAGSGGGSSTGLVGGAFTIRGTGQGHQVGMSQWGAFSMAHYHNLTFEDIIHFYFTDVEITRTTRT